VLASVWRQQRALEVWVIGSEAVRRFDKDEIPFDIVPPRKDGHVQIDPALWEHYEKLDGVELRIAHRKVRCE
jgi:hypothetical protein